VKLFEEVKMQRILTAVALTLLVGYTVCQLPEGLDGVQDQINNIEGLENFNSSQLPTEEDVDRLVKEKCEKNGGGEEAFNALKGQKDELRACLEAHLNATVIQEEIEKSKKTGSMDEVFGKYCKKYPEIYACVEKVTDKMKLCLDPAEQETMNKTLKIVGELKEFICFKDGDRIAMFIAEGGVECLESRKDELQVCVNQTVGSRIPTDMSVNSLPAFLFTDRECNDFDTIRTCFNDELEKCKDSTPANIVDAFFKFLKKHMPCDKDLGQMEPLSESSTGAASAIFVTSFATVAVSALISRYL
jgi:hypothetical protein